MTSPAKRSVLILCTGNSCRSQIAEALWRHLAGEQWSVTSAGTRPAGFVHPLAIAALQEIGVETSGLYSKSLDAFRDRPFDCVITVCDAAQQACPSWLNAGRRLQWPFPDPAKSRHSDEKLGDFVAVRDAIRDRIESFLGDEHSANPGDPESLARSSAIFDEHAARATIRLAHEALAEDLQGRADLTSAALIPESAQGHARFVARVGGTICGIEVCRLIFDQFGAGLAFTASRRDGDRVEPGDEFASIAGNARTILILERTCLNFLGKLSGISTLTAEFVRRVAGTRASILDTRKTTPGWRALEKYAVRCGGGRNHRLGLYDGILIKDNHVAICAQLPPAEQLRIDQAVERARDWLAQHQPPSSASFPIEVEVATIEQFDLALKGKPDIVLLDNMSIDALRECVTRRGQIAPDILLEASGGVRLDNVAEIAATGVDRISIGALTHSAPNFDIGLDWREFG